MVKRLILTVVMAAGGTGAYIYGSGSNLKENAELSAPLDGSSESGEEGGWQVEYVDGEGNPIQRDAAYQAAARLKVTSNSILKRIPGVSAARRISNSDASSTHGTQNQSLKRSGG